MISLPPRQLRVFVSSTFQDMVNERTVLLEKVFPRITAYCHRKKTEFIAVDLRWGITEEQARRGETVSVCMAEIDRARPLFLGIVGERYGWVPPGAEQSVTEQEIRYGALEAPPGTEAFFYLRRKDLTESLCGPSEPDARLLSLRQRILESGYPVMDGYADLESFADRVCEDLRGAVDRLTADDAVRSPMDEVRLDQLFQMRRFASGCVDRPAEHSRLEEMVRKGGLILLTGENGVGKTSFFSSFAQEQEKKGRVFLFIAFIGSAADKGWQQLVRRLLAELRARFGPDIPDAEDPEGLRRALFRALNTASRESPLLLMLDHLDALDLEDSFGLSWLPESLPEGVSVVATLNEGEALERLRLRSHAELRLGRFSPDAVGRVTRQCLSAWSKTLTAEQLDLFLGSPSARNPLFLMTVLNEIRCIGQYERLTDQIRDYLSCGGQAALFEKVLSRLDRDYDEGIGLPRRLFILLEASRSGLSEPELLSLLGDLPYARFAPLSLLLESFLTVSDGALQIDSPAFRAAVLRHYQPRQEELDAARAQLIDWFTAHPETPRRSRMLPRLLTDAEAYGQLAALLSDPSVFSEIWNRNRYEARAYWASLSSRGFSPAERYRSLLSRPEAPDPDLALILAELFLDNGEPDAAERLLETLTAPGAAGDAQRCAAFGLLGNLLYLRGDFAASAGCYRQKASLAEKLGDRYEQVRALGNLGSLSLVRGKPEEAEKAFESVLTLARSLNQRDAEQIALGNLGRIAFNRGQAAEARALYERQKSISRDSGNPAGIINACGALGILFLREKDYPAAEKEFAQQEAESRRIGAPDGLANALGNLASLARFRGDRARAESFLEEKLRVCRQTGHILSIQNALGNLAALAAERGDPETALARARERLELTRRCRAFRQYYEALLQLSALEHACGMEADSGRHRLEAEALGRQHGFSQAGNQSSGRNDRPASQEEST